MVMSRSNESTVLENAIMSDLLSPEDNPSGYFFAVSGTAVCAALLLPLTMVIRPDINGGQRCWLSIGTWLFRIGLFLSIAIAMTTPFQESYIPSHVNMAFMAFAAMAAGLAVILIAAAYLSRTLRLTSALLGSLHALALIFLAYMFSIPNYFEGRRWVLGLCEWLLAAVIAIGTIAAVRGAAEKPNPASEGTA